MSAIVSAGVHTCVTSLRTRCRSGCSHQSVVTPAVFDTRGIAYAAWTLTALCLGAFLGTLFRRVLPAMATSLAAYLMLGALTWFYLHDRYPVSTFWPMQLFESGWLLALSALLVAATIRLVNRHAT